MAYQKTQMKDTPYPETSSRSAEDVYPGGPIQGVTRGASSVLNDALDLAELQSKLLAADAKQFVESVKFGVLGLVVTLALLIAALPVVALGFAEWVSWGLEWPLWVCLLGTGLMLLSIGLGLGLWCVKRFRVSLQSFSVSKQEAGENIRWLRQALNKTFSN